MRGVRQPELRRLGLVEGVLTPPGAPPFAAVRPRFPSSVLAWPTLEGADMVTMRGARARWLLLALVPSVALAATIERMALVTSNGRTGTLTMTTEGRTVDVDWRVDDNGRGPKIREHIVLGANGLPASRIIEGTSTFGAPVKETFSVEGGKARWTSTDDQGEAPAGDALYVDNRGSPWTVLHFVKVMLGSKRLTRAALPSGTLRLQKLRELTIGPAKERVQAYALWGTTIGTPTLLLVRGTTLVASVNPYAVLTREEHAGRFAELSGIARDLNAELLRDLARRLTHPAGRAAVDHPRAAVRPAVRHGEHWTERGALSRPHRRSARGPAAGWSDGHRCAAAARSCPGLFDSHAHTGDWDGLARHRLRRDLGARPGQRQRHRCSRSMRALRRGRAHRPARLPERLPGGKVSLLRAVRLRGPDARRGDGPGALVRRPRVLGHQDLQLDEPRRS